jgi:lantibiotic modifying enzyme
MEIAERISLIEASLEAIAEDCHGFVPKRKSTGLYSGKAGLVLFYAYLARQTGKERHFDLYSRLLDECILDVNDVALSGTLVAGVPGIAWLIRHLVHIGMLDESAVELLEPLEPLIVESLEVDLARKDYELFTGVAGKGLYFLEGPMTPIARRGIERILEILQEGAVAEGEGISWLREKWSTGEVFFDLGVPHGISGIILFLCRVSGTGIEPDGVRRLIEGAVAWVMSKEQAGGLGHFPHIAGREFSGRLAWCYGDLGVASALLAAGEALSLPDLKEKALATFRKDAARDIRTASVFRHKQYGIYDRGLCHGTAGIALIFNHMYKKTGGEEHRHAAEYWTDLTLSIKPAGKGKGLAGYLFPHTDSDKRWVSNPYLLEGSTGVGLFYLSLLNEERSAWKKLLMLP